MAVLSLNFPQNRFILSQKKFRAFVGGYRSGKTFVGCTRLGINAYQNPGMPQGYFAPTYPQIRDIFYPTIEEVGEKLGFDVDIKTTDKEVFLSRNGSLYGMIKCRSMDNPGSIVGFNIAHALVDEIDTMNKAKALNAWRKIIARMSTNWNGYDFNTIDVTTTPEGFGFVYDQFVRELKSKPELNKFYEIVHASTKENAVNLPNDYIPSLYATYPEELVDAYIDGRFVNLTSGRVYTNFSRSSHHSNREASQNDELHIGIDFNVGNMSAVVHVIDNGLPVAVDEICKELDTPAMIREIRRKYSENKINVYPDSTGQNRKSNDASITDISQLRDAGFRMCHESVNPFVKDRIAAVQSMFLNGKKEIRYRVNTNKCPMYTDDLEQQVYADSGEPDKKAGNDHRPDAAGYFIAYKYPIIRPLQNPVIGLPI